MILYAQYSSLYVKISATSAAIKLQMNIRCATEAELIFFRNAFTVPRTMGMAIKSRAIRSNAVRVVMIEMNSSEAIARTIKLKSSATTNLFRSNK